MAVHQLGRIADGVARDGSLTKTVNGFIFNRTVYNLEAQAAEQCVPEGKQLIHIQAHRYTHNAAFRRFVNRQFLEQLQLLTVQVQLILGCHVGDGALAAVAADKAFAAGKDVDSEVAMVIAQTAGHALDCMDKFTQLLQVEQRCLMRCVLVAALRVQSGAVGSHKACNVGADNIQVHLLLKSAQYAVVEEGASLNNDVLADGLLAGRTDNLI